MVERIEQSRKKRPEALGNQRNETIWRILIALPVGILVYELCLGCPAPRGQTTVEKAPPAPHLSAKIDRLSKVCLKHFCTSEFDCVREYLKF